MKKLIPVFLVFFFLYSCASSNVTTTTATNSITMPINTITTTETTSLAKENIIYDDNDLVITLSEEELDFDTRVSIRLNLTNNSSQSRNVVLKWISINNFLMSNTYHKTLAANDNEHIILDFDTSYLKNANIRRIREFTMVFQVNTLADVPIFETAPLSLVINDDVNITDNIERASLINYQGLDFSLNKWNSSTNGSSIVFEIEFFIHNTLDNDLSINISNVVINGENSFEYEELIILPHDKKLITGFYISTLDLSFIEVAEISSITCTITITYGLDNTDIPVSLYPISK